jgi:signal transduction histidine kinase
LEKAKDQMLLEAAHLIESPLHRAIQWADILKEYELTKEEQTDMLAKAFDDVKSCIDFVDRIVIFTRLESGIRLSLQPLGVAEFINTVCANRLSDARERNVQSRKICESNLVVNADEQMLTQVLDNLISNALNFAPEKTVITVSAKGLDERVEIKLFNKGPKLSRKELERCFEPTFSTTSPRLKRKGLGLGLPIARCIARLHGGDIKAANRHSGVVFTIILPREIIKILSTECLHMKEFANLQELETFAAQFVTYYNQYRAHGGIGYKPPVWWYVGASPKVKGLSRLWGLEAVAQQWSRESSAEAPIVVTKEKLARCKALVPIA